MDVKAVGAVLVYVVIVLTSTALTGGAGLHTGERRLKYGHFFAQTLYDVSCEICGIVMWNRRPLLTSGSYSRTDSHSPDCVWWRAQRSLSRCLPRNGRLVGLHLAAVRRAHCVAQMALDIDSSVAARTPHGSDG